MNPSVGYGYDMEASDMLSSTFNGEGYDGIVLLRDINFIRLANFVYSHSDAELNYIPTERIVGISKLAELLVRKNCKIKNELLMVLLMILKPIFQAWVRR